MTAAYKDTADGTEWPQKTLRSYVRGFTLCLLVTFISFGLVKYPILNKTMLYFLLAVFATLQMIIQAVFFLGLQSKAESRWNIFPFLFILMIIIFLVGGSLWIMHDLSVLTMGMYMTFS